MTITEQRVFPAVDWQGYDVDLVYTRYVIDTTTMRNRTYRSHSPGSSIKTRDGLKVKRVSCGRYEVMGHPDMTFTSDSPDAP